MTVLVHADGRLELVTIPQNLEVYSIPKCPPLSATFQHDPQYLTIPTVDYLRRGKMFDGRPVFCAAGLDVQEARASKIVTERDVLEHEAEALAELDRAIEQLLKRWAVVIELDAWRGRLPAAPHEADAFKAQQLARVGARRLVAVRT